MARKNRLKIKDDGLVVNADIRTEKLTETEIEDYTEIVRRDPQGSRVDRQVYDKESGEALEEGYGYRWVNEEGGEVDPDDVQYFEVVGGEEQRVEPHEPTLGRDRTLQPIRWVPLSELGEFLVTRTYEVWAEDGEDVSQLYELADHIRVHARAPVVPVVLQHSLQESWGIVTPQFYDDSFSLLMRVTRSRVEPQHHMPVLPQEDVDEEEERSPTQESPFR